MGQNAIIFDCERMKYEETGIYYYCLHLGRALQERMCPTERLAYYVPGNARHLFTGPVLQQHPIHKIFLPPVADFTIWHSTFQHSDYLPCLNRSIKVVLTVHDLNFMYDDRIPDLKKKKYLVNLQKRVNRADVLVCVSEYAKKDLTAFCSTFDKPVLVIHNGTNTLHKPLLGPASFKPRRPFLFSIGSIRRKKNFHALLPLVKQNSDLDLVIAGKPEDAEYLSDLENMAKKEGVRDNLYMIGQVSEPEKSWYYHNCRAFLLPSIAEGFGLPLVEAMSAGKPAFVSGCTALPEIGSTAAFYFKDFSKENMQASFISGMKQYEAHNMTDMIKKRAGLFSWEKAADDYINVYRSLNTEVKR